MRWAFKKVSKFSFKRFKKQDIIRILGGRKIKKIAFVHYFALDKPIGSTAIIERTKELAKMGLRIYLICAQNKKAKALHKDIRVRAFARLKLPDFINYVLFNVFAFFELIALALNKKINILHAYPKSVLPSVFVARLFKKPLVVDFRDQISVFANSAKKSFKARFFSFCERLAVRNADHLFAISDETKKYLKGLGARQDITVVPSGVNFDLFNPERIKTNVRKIWSIPESSKLILYSGSLDKMRDCDKIIDAVAACNDNSLHLMLVGDGPAKDYLEKYGRKKLGSKFTITGFVPYQQVPDYIYAADLCTCYLRPSSHFSASSPLKIIEYLAMNKPVVATNIGPHKVIEHLDAGALFNPGSIQEFAKTIKAQINREVQTRDKLKGFSHSKLAIDYRLGYYKAIENLKRKVL